MDHAVDVRQRDVLDAQAHRHQQIDAGQSRGTGAGGDKAHVLQRLALQQQAVADRGGDSDRGAVLIVVEHRDLHAPAQFGFDAEAFGRLDILQVDRAEGRFQRRHDVAEQFRVLGIDLDVEDVDSGEFLEQDGLALHHRLAGEGADVAEAEHGRAVGDHGDQIAAGGVVVSAVRVGLDRLAGGGDAGGVGQRQIALRRHALGRLDGQLPGPRQAVVVERGLADILIHPGWRPLVAARRSLHVVGPCGSCIAGTTLA